MGLKCRAVRRVSLALQIVGCISLSFLVTACTENSAPPQLETYAYSSAPVSARCETGTRIGRAGASDGEASADGLRYQVRTPSNYDVSIAHPLLIVYAAAGQSGLASERMTGLTPTATASGFVIVYADHRPLGIPAIEQLGTISGLVAKKWCIDEKRVFVTGHSDGGTASLALAVFDKTKKIPAAIAPSAAGWRGKDLEAYQCPAPIPVMVMHGANDSLFPGWGAQTAAWWAACNGCDGAKTKKVDGGCVAYQGCASGGVTLYCEGAGSHRDWPNLNRVMIEFFVHPDKFL
ncbi:MAG: poly(3-hydroxybutyrate) depolymerase [Nitrospira sp.]|nr:poly(3-hydroxybutyrate) depolymerase [Nitrospira sp.]